MIAKVEYDSYVDRPNSATVAVLALLVVLVVLALGPSQIALAQINGPPASVTSSNFGGHFNPSPGVPASVTSVGPRGLQPRSQFSTQPGCCGNPFSPGNSNPSLFQHRRHHRGENSFFPAGGAFYVPYPVVQDPETSDVGEDPNQNPNPADDYRGGPTIFDRRGSGQPARSFLDDYPQRAHKAQPETESAPPAAQAEVSVPDQTPTLLVFKDGHHAEVQNYAVVGDMLYDLTPGHHRKIALADLDLKATAKQNDDIGNTFQLPPTLDTNK
jgi:hypothetical protein